MPHFEQMADLMRADLGLLPGPARLTELSLTNAASLPPKG
ncbi:MAG: hypothetical protein ACI8R4_004127 [Paracoccaceae bacterium]|jgi:hypothetical protein